MNRATTPTRALAAVAMVGVFGAYALSLAAGAQAVSAADGPHKAFVCKYVGSPGKNERLQTGNNPISVAFSAIDAGPGRRRLVLQRRARALVRPRPRQRSG